MLGLALGRQTEKAWSRPVGSGDSLCDGGEGRIGFAIEPIAAVECLDLVGPAIPLADEMGAGRNGPCGSAGAWCPVHHGTPDEPPSPARVGFSVTNTDMEKNSGCSSLERSRLRNTSKSPKARHGSGTMAFVQENAAQENLSMSRERAWRSSPKRFAPRPAVPAGEVQTVQNDVPANPCILRHHRTFALVLDKVQSNEGLPGAKFTTRSSPRSRFEPAVRTPGGPVARHPQPRRRKPALRREIPSILRGFQGRLSC